MENTTVKHVYNFDGEHHVLQFDSKEDKWFLDWVISQRKLKLSLLNVKALVKDIKLLRKKKAELEKENQELLDLFGQKESSEREKQIKQFNKKYNRIKK